MATKRKRRFWMMMDDKEDFYKIDPKEAVISWVDNLVSNKQKADELFRATCDSLVAELK